MGVLLSQKISMYYERFKDIDVTFTKDMIQITGLLTQQIHLKCGNDFWPCVVYTASFSGAKVVANVKTFRNGQENYSVHDLGGGALGSSSPVWKSARTDVSMSLRRILNPIGTVPSSKLMPKATISFFPSTASARTNFPFIV
ncbi:hypothetical protein R84B8_00488 [Treponema sp. R8-4-B8]